MSTAVRKAVKRGRLRLRGAGLKLVSVAPAAVHPTPVGRRSHTFKHGTRLAINGEPGNVGKIRPTKLAIARYGVRDLGWQEPARYVSKAGNILKAAQA